MVFNDRGGFFENLINTVIFGATPEYPSSCNLGADEDDDEAT